MHEITGLARVCADNHNSLNVTDKEMLAYAVMNRRSCVAEGLGIPPEVDLILSKQDFSCDCHPGTNKLDEAHFCGSDLSKGFGATCGPRWLNNKAKAVEEENDCGATDGEALRAKRKRSLSADGADRKEEKVIVKEVPVKLAGVDISAINKVSVIISRVNASEDEHDYESILRNLGNNETANKPAGENLPSQSQQHTNSVVLEAEDQQEENISEDDPVAKGAADLALLGFNRSFVESNSGRPRPEAAEDSAK